MSSAKLQFSFQGLIAFFFSLLMRINLERFIVFVLSLNPFQVVHLRGSDVTMGVNDYTHLTLEG